MPSLVVNTNVDLGSDDDKKKMMLGLTEVQQQPSQTRALGWSPSLLVLACVVCDLARPCSCRVRRARCTRQLPWGWASPDSYVAIQLNDKQSMMWGGSTEPLALCTCTSLGAINLTNNKKVVEKVRTSVPRPPSAVALPPCRSALETSWVH